MRPVLLAVGVAAALVNAGAQAAETLVADGAPADSGWFAGERGVQAKLSAGPTVLGHQYGAVGGAALEMALGAQTSNGGWYGDVRFAAGADFHGSSLRVASLGLSWEAPIVRDWHVGLGVGPVAAWGEGDATSSEALVGVAGRAFTTYDVGRIGRSAVFLGLGGEGDLLMVPIWGASVCVGARIAAARSSR